MEAGGYFLGDTESFYSNLLTGCAAGNKDQKKKKKNPPWTERIGSNYIAV